MNTPRYIAGIELGGTKTIAFLARGEDILERITVPTTKPEETLSAVRRQLEIWHADTGFDAIGIASFGPIQLQREAPDHGYMLKTPKPHWSGASIAPYLTDGFGRPWKFDTDVNGAALAEYKWGAGIGCSSLCYITIGTGVGGGLIINGQPVHGSMHPEIGHVFMRRAEGDTFEGSCPFHGDCIEGLVSGPALAARFGAAMDTVADSHPVWAHVADDIAELAAMLLLTTSAQRILFGGGVSMSRPFLMPMIHARVVSRLAGYLPFVDAESVQKIVTLPALGADAGPRGALALALAALQD